MSKRHSHWWYMKTVCERVKKGLSTDRDRWLYIRKSYTKEANPGFYGGEYDKLCADWRVSKLVVSEDEGIRLTTLPVIKTLHYSGIRHTVYLGTYEIRVKPMTYSLLFRAFAMTSITTTFRVQCIHSGRYDGKLQTTYPVNSDHNFCFGDRKDFIEELANAGEFYTFFNVVLDSLWHINQISRLSVIRDFRKVDEHANLEPLRINHVPYTDTADY